MRKAALLGVALAFCLARVSSASVSIVSDPGMSTEGLGSFAATLTYAAVDASNASLQIAITNTSSPANGGLLVAFLFNNPNNQITGVTRTTDSNLLTLLGGGSFNNTIKAAPFANFDIGVSLGGNNNNGFEGAGGNPNAGIGVGQTGNFTFSFVGSNLNLLNENSFIESLNKTDGQFLVARFKGFKNGGSDKVPAQVAIVPEPASFAVWSLLGVTAVVARKYKRKSNTSRD